MAHPHGTALCIIVAALYGGPPLTAQIAASPEFTTALDRICGGSLSTASVDALLDQEVHLARSASSAELDRTTVWQLACVRTRLAAHGAFGREGYLMPQGTSWRHGASGLAARLLDDSVSTEAAELLALLSTDRVLAEPPEWTLAYMERAIDAGVVAPLVLRQCSAVAWRMEAAERAKACAEAGLISRADVTFHLLTLARVAALQSDTAVASRAFLSAAGVARDTTDVRDLYREVRWFLSPAEDSAWQKLEQWELAHWLSAMLKVRDVRDGRPEGARVVEHFHRLAFAEANFRMIVLPVNRARLRSRAALRDVDGGDFTVEPTTPTSKTPADQFRIYTRWQTDLDDRGAVWLRFGEPLKRALYVDTGAGSSLTRETWRYELDGRSLLLSFESEKGDGTGEPTRLVSGVIGEHFCDIDFSRCHQAVRSWQDAEFNRFKGGPPGSLLGIFPEERAAVSRQDQAQIVTATTLDDNALRSPDHIELSAQFLRLWHPGTGELVAVVPWAIRAQDLEEDSTGRAAPLRLEVRSFDAATGASWDSTLGGIVPIPRRRRDNTYVTGVNVVRAAEGVTAWSVIARQDSAAGRVFSTTAPPLGNGPLQLSDLVTGAVAQGVSWEAPSGAVTLAPLGNVSKREPLKLYYQVKSALPESEVTTTVALYRTGAKADSTPAMQVSFDERLGTGLTEVRRELGLGQLDIGSYRLEARVAAASGAHLVTRSTPLNIR